jgi:hypothetical protein
LSIMTNCNMNMRGVLLPVALLVYAIFAAPSLAADLRADVAHMLQIGATRSLASFADSQAAYQSLKSRAPGDPRLGLAWAMVLLEQRKYADALPFLAAQIRENPADLDTTCWYAWALVQCRRYDHALEAAMHIGRRITDVNLASEEARYAAARQLGQILGYLERVKPGTVTSEKLTSVKNRLLSQLNRPLLDSLDTARLEIAEKFAALQAEQVARHAERTATVEQQQQDARDSLDGNRQKVADRQAELDSTNEKLRDATREWEVLQKQISDLAANRTRLTAQIAVAQAQLSDASFAQAQQIALGLTGFQKQGIEMDRRLMALNTRATELRGAGATETQTVARGEADIRNAAKRAGAMEKRIRQLENAKPSGPALSSQMRSLSTYIPFPYDQQQARVLQLFDGD